MMKYLILVQQAPILVTAAPKTAVREANLATTATSASINAATTIYERPTLKPRPYPHWPKRCPVNNSRMSGRWAKIEKMPLYTLPECSHVTWQLAKEHFGPKKNQARLASPEHATVDLPGMAEFKDSPHRHEEQVRFIGPRSFLEGVHRRVNKPSLLKDDPLPGVTVIYSQVKGILFAGRHGRKFKPTTNFNNGHQGTFELGIDYLLETKLMYAGGKFTRPMYANEAPTDANGTVLPGQSWFDGQTYPAMGNMPNWGMKGSYNYKICYPHATGQNPNPLEPPCIPKTYPSPLTPYKELGMKYLGKTYTVVNHTGRQMRGYYMYPNQYVAHVVYTDPQNKRRTAPFDGLGTLLNGSLVSTEGVKLYPWAYTMPGKAIETIGMWLDNGLLQYKNGTFAELAADSENLRGYVDNALEQLVPDYVKKGEEPPASDNDNDRGATTTSTGRASTSATVSTSVAKVPVYRPRPSSAGIRAFMTLPRARCAGAPKGSERQVFPNHYWWYEKNMHYARHGRLLFRADRTCKIQANWNLTVFPQATVLV